MATGLSTTTLTAPLESLRRAGDPPIGYRELFTRHKVLFVGVAVVLLLMWLACSWAFAGAAVDSFGLAAAPVNIASVIFLAGVVIAAIGFVFQPEGQTPGVANLRASRFAEENGLRYTKDAKRPKLRGLIFEQGGHREISRMRFRSGDTHPFPFEVAHYSYHTGAEYKRKDNSDRTRWTYIAVTAGRRLPRMVLDAKANDGWFGSSVPESLAKSQVLSLEGDFDRYFTLYVPKDYERDALYVFTPDVMARLIDDAAGFDVETADDRIIFFTRSELDLTSPQVWDTISRLVFGAGAKMIGQTDRYADFRAEAGSVNRIGSGGTSLRTRRITPALLWTVAGAALLIAARLLFTGPLNGMI